MKEIIAELKAKMKKPGIHIIKPIEPSHKIFWVRKGTTPLFDIDYDTGYRYSYSSNGMVTSFDVEPKITLNIPQRIDRDRRTTKYYSATPSQPEYRFY